MKREQAKGARPDDAHAFLPDPSETGEPLRAGDATYFATEYVESALTGESVSEDGRDEVVDDEEGGPFLVLDDDAKLLPEPEEAKPERDGHEDAKHEQVIRGGRWAARGA
jgi:hypothetical protein